MSNKDNKSFNKRNVNPIHSIVEEFSKVFAELINLASRGMSKLIILSAERISKRAGKKNDAVSRASTTYRNLMK